MYSAYSAYSAYSVYSLTCRRIFRAGLIMSINGIPFLRQEFRSSRTASKSVNLFGSVVAHCAPFLWREGEVFSFFFLFNFFLYKSFMCLFNQRLLHLLFSFFSLARRSATKSMSQREEKRGKDESRVLSTRHAFFLPANLLQRKSL